MMFWVIFLTSHSLFLSDPCQELRTLERLLDKNSVHDHHDVHPLPVCRSNFLLHKATENPSEIERSLKKKEHAKTKRRNLETVPLSSYINQYKQIELNYR